LIIIFIFVFPVIKSIQLSTTNAKFIEDSKFIGLQNYLKAAKDYYFWHALIILLLYTIVYTVGIFLVGFITAILLDKSTERYKSIFRTFFILPYAIPDVVAGMIALWMLDYQFGIINYLLTKLHLVKEPVLWFNDPTLALITVISIEIWRLFPLHTLVIFAGLQDVPEELYEAADIDGAGSFIKFFKITLPYLKQILVILIMLTIIWCFKRFTIIWLLTRGGPNRGTETVVIQIYSYAFSFNKMGYAAAIGNILLLITIGLVIFYFNYSRKEA
jgi:multiple sugar transport system permease protein